MGNLLQQQRIGPFRFKPFQNILGLRDALGRRQIGIRMFKQA